MCLLSRRWETWPCGHHREDEPELEEICPARRDGDVTGCNRNIRWTDEASPIILPSQERCPECRGECDNNTNVSDAMLFFRDRDALARRVYETRRRHQRQSAGGDAQYGGGPQVGGRPNQQFQTADSFRDALSRSARSPAARSNGSPLSASGPKLPPALQEAIRRFRNLRPGQNRPLLIDRSLAPGAAGNQMPGSPRPRLPSGPHYSRGLYGFGSCLGRSQTPMPGVGHGFRRPVSSPLGGLTGDIRGPVNMRGNTMFPVHQMASPGRQAGSSNPLGGLFGDIHGPGNTRGGNVFPANNTALPGLAAGNGNNPFEGLLREIQASRNSGTGIGEMEIPVRTNVGHLGDIGQDCGQRAFPAHGLQDPVILSPTEGIARVPGGLVVFNPSIVGYPPSARDGGGLHGYCGGAHQWP
ncbi:hypothetical protein PspLS_06967 [Pyricularia sp. CBS 133598]|nr:hypothetical protein PspLS_06967 [Pyricularia sp. CBS 133598]